MNTLKLKSVLPGVLAFLAVWALVGVAHYAAGDWMASLVVVGIITVAAIGVAKETGHASHTGFVAGLLTIGIAMLEVGIRNSPFGP